MNFFDLSFIYFLFSLLNRKLSFTTYATSNKLLIYQDEESRNKEENRPELFKAMKNRNISIAKDEEEKEARAAAAGDEEDSQSDGEYSDESDYSDEYSDESEYSDEEDEGS